MVPLFPPTLADPTLGLGMSCLSAMVTRRLQIGLQLFTNDQQDSFVGSVGIDCMPCGQSWRATAGAAYLGSNSCLGLDMGLNLNGGGPDFGIGAGAAQSQANLNRPDPCTDSPTVCTSEHCDCV